MREVQRESFEVVIFRLCFMFCSYFSLSMVKPVQLCIVLFGKNIHENHDICIFSLTASVFGYTLTDESTFLRILRDEHAREKRI